MIRPRLPCAISSTSRSRPGRSTGSASGSPVAGGDGFEDDNRALRAVRPTRSKPSNGISSRGSFASDAGMAARASPDPAPAHGNDISRVGGVEASVHCENWFERLGIKFAGSPGRLADCASVGAGDQNYGGPPGVAQGLKRLAKAILLHLQTGMWAETGRASVVVLQKAGPRLGQAQQPQGWPVGAVSKMMWSKPAMSPSSSPTNSSKAAISVVQAPESCSRTVDSPQR